jgi:NAD(P)-dependent dehydrogenase (short-subunit alcohol dehydrogenase family)
MDLDLAGRIAVLAGCSVGIGREIAKTLASEASKRSSSRVGTGLT